MAASTTLWDWRDGELVIVDQCETGETTMEAADSFLVSQAKVLALGLHQERFTESAVERGFPERSELDRFWRSGLAVIPHDGAWFPRFELVTNRGALLLRFRLRTAPGLRDSLVVATAPSDPRRVPEIKGPDIAALSRLRQQAQRQGADEAVILDDGRVSDGATTALLWWRGDALFTPPLVLPRVDSVAARTVRGVAAALRVPVDEEAVTPAQLAGTSLWAVNALHGIRSVTAWVGGPELSPDSVRTAAWRARLGALARPLP